MYVFLNVCKQMTDVNLLLLNSNTWNHLTVCNKVSGIFTTCLTFLFFFFTSSPHDLILASGDFRRDPTMQELCCLGSPRSN